MLLEPVGRIGRACWIELRRLVSYATLFVLTVEAIGVRRQEGGAVVRQQAARQVVRMALNAVGLVSFLGAMGALVFTVGLARKLGGIEDGRAIVILVRLLVREVSPFVTAIVVALRSGAALTAELGTMSARGEVEGVEALGIDPVRLLVLPRFVGMVTANVGLTVVFASVSIATMAVSGAVLGVSSAGGEALWGYGRAIAFSDVIWALVKAATLGITSAAVVCYHGLSVRRDLTEVPPRVARGLVETLVHSTLLSAALALISL